MKAREFNASDTDMEIVLVGRLIYWKARTTNCFAWGTANSCAQAAEMVESKLAHFFEQENALD